jgi:hypothetical protein
MFKMVRPPTIGVDLMTEGVHGRVVIVGADAWRGRRVLEREGRLLARAASRLSTFVADYARARGVVAVQLKEVSAAAEKAFA